ncbi:hypothetical protein G1L02_04285 [Tenacibaculum finnmarkense]|uniref:hypothetical protein n=1 Tax=Tenacibaculum finnmarkense TaxID=2781243 RepID=UPI001E3A7B5E|nr:hypothetical protein [Tenacibaculum finnmarkense]MCD8431870.1 hypothetical protein [Tenacibaculum finnmarkense genomovar ulcerans]MCD8443458.1 hypothetical protein [Tenacibaculum finnmarkense genomovar ulcerans]MCG8807340.1 hypothetical protein [Tenacibaculum finnmarkense]MCG8817581.1 hypothetical protein [Tenacibaculum finnmarkense]MCG8882378.1 hypothetical protein [Tenacibaculum finnmarkense]
MKKYLSGFVERLKRHSDKLDNYALLTEQPWITKTDDNNERFLMIFRQKENELLISLNGKIEKAKWDYIPSMNSLVIERNSGITLYKQGFFDDSVMILKVDGTEDYQLFVNENKIDSTIEKLLEETENKYFKKKKLILEKKKSYNQIINKTLKDGRNFKIYSSLDYGYTIGDKVTINGELPIDGEYSFGWFDSLLVIDGKLKRL